MSREYTRSFLHLMNCKLLRQRSKNLWHSFQRICVIDPLPTVTVMYIAWMLNLKSHSWSSVYCWNPKILSPSAHSCNNLCIWTCYIFELNWIVLNMCFLHATSWVVVPMFLGAEILFVVAAKLKSHSSQFQQCVFVGIQDVMLQSQCPL